VLSGAVSRCANTPTGGRGGWRLPTAGELVSLLESSSGLFVTGHLPSGNPFLFGAPFASYWSSTAVVGVSVASFWQLGVTTDGTGVGILNPSTPDFPHSFWCVRGGQVN
jgi:hypothetical protein